MKKAIFLLWFSAVAQALALEPCAIQVVDKENGWPVPLVQLRTTHELRFITDNNGLVACAAPELMGNETWFFVTSHGYEASKDGFGFRGIRLRLEPGKQFKIEVQRLNIAKRLGRITGAGLFAESQKLGRELDWKDSGVFGSDSVQNAIYHGKMFWAWGDTLLQNYPLGIFDMSSATTAVQPLQSFQPPVRLKLAYFRDEKGRPRGVANIPGSGPTWLGAYVTLMDKNGQAHLVATYSKIKPPLEAYEYGLCEWKDKKQQFERWMVIWSKSANTQKAPLLPMGHPTLWKSEGKEWLLVGDPLPKFKCPANFESWQDTNTWEQITPAPTFKSASDDSDVKPHSGHIAWNAFRKRWVTIFMQAGGKPSLLGELWYAEADSPLGPWGKAVKVLTHENYTFYNPRLHPEFTPADSSFLIFEGTYTSEFANRPHPTERYNYNQILYRLDLDDPKLKVAQQGIGRLN